MGPNGRIFRNKFCLKLHFWVVFCYFCRHSFCFHTPHFAPLSSKSVKINLFIERFAHCLFLKYSCILAWFWALTKFQWSNQISRKACPCRTILCKIDPSCLNWSAGHNLIILPSRLSSSKVWVWQRFLRYTVVGRN